MIKIELSKDYPNQSFPTNQEGYRYTITIKDCGDFMSISIDRDDETIISNARLLPNELILPYTYLSNGNFILETKDDELPSWEKFGITQELFYITKDELMGV